MEAFAHENLVGVLYYLQCGAVGAVDDSQEALICVGLATHWALCLVLHSVQH